MSKQVIKTYCGKICEQEGLGKPKISVRNSTKTSWGLCYTHIDDSNTIRLNKGMLLHPKLLKKYCGVDLFDVLLHEVAHLKHSRHDKEFWDYHKQLLKKYSKLKKEFMREFTK